MRFRVAVLGSMSLLIVACSGPTSSLPQSSHASAPAASRPSFQTGYRFYLLNTIGHDVDFRWNGAHCMKKWPDPVNIRSGFPNPGSQQYVDFTRNRDIFNGCDSEWAWFYMKFTDSKSGGIMYLRSEQKPGFSWHERWDVTLHEKIPPSTPVTFCFRHDYAQYFTVKVVPEGTNPCEGRWWCEKRGKHEFCVAAAPQSVRKSRLWGAPIVGSAFG